MSMLVKNAGLVLSGDIKAPLLDADSIIIEDGLIKEIGQGLAAPEGARVVDAAGAAVTPACTTCRHRRPLLAVLLPHRRSQVRTPPACATP